MSRRNVFQGLAPKLLLSAGSTPLFCEGGEKQTLLIPGAETFFCEFPIAKMQNAWCFKCWICFMYISWWCKTICIYVYIYLCGYIEKYNKLMDIQNMYYIYIHMCLYDIWLPAGSLQRKLLTLCITPQRSGLSVMYNP